MTRQKVLVTNADKSGKPYDPPKWFVRVGRDSKTFDQASWENGGLAWINAALRGDK